MAAALIPIFAAIHVLGALIGSGTTTFAEIFYIQAVADAKIDHHERHYLRRMYRGIHVGMTLVVLAGIALMVLEYLVPNATQDVMVAPFWAIQTFALVILLLGALIAKHEVSWWFSSAAILTAWWFMLVLDVGYLSQHGYVNILMLYVLVTFLVAGALGYLRVMTRSLYIKRVQAHK